VSASQAGGPQPRRASSAEPVGDEGQAGDLKIELNEGSWLWSWKLSRWNYHQHKWDRQRWKPVTTGSACSESGARKQADKAIRKLRTAKEPKRIVYYGQLRGRESDDSDDSGSIPAPVLRPIRWLGRRVGL
jgi:hypothetical protein